MNRLGVLAQTAALAGLTLVAGWWFIGVFVAGSAFVPLAAMVVGVTVVLVAIRLLGVPPLLADLALGALSVMAVLVVVAATRSDQPVTDVSEGLINGWARILTTSLPVAGRMDLLVAPMVLLGLATVVGVSALLRSRSVWLPLAPLMGVAAVGLAFGDGTASQPWLLMAGLVGGSGLLALIRTGLPVSEASLDERVADEPTLAMPALGGLAALAGAVGLAVLLAGLTPVHNESKPFTLRHYVTQDQNDVRLVSPISRAEELAGIERVMTVEAVDAIPAGTRVRIASLDTYDGLGWSPATRLSPVGSELPGLGLSGTKLKVVITPMELGLPWIPTVGEPTAIRSGGDGSGTLLLWSSTTGNIATSDLSTSDGTEWEVSGVAPAPSAEQLTAARLAPCLPLELGDRDQQEVVKSLRTQAKTIVGTDTGSLAAALRLVAFFGNEAPVHTGEDFAVDPEAASSPALGGVIRFMDGRVGNRFQFATSYAVVAQMACIPARVAVGAKLEEAVAKGDTIEVSGEELTAWPEVNVSGLGWIALDPVPDEEGKASGAVEEKLEEAIDEAASSDPDELPSPDDPPTVTKTDPDEQPEGAGSIWWMATLGLIAVVLGLIATPMFRLLRRHKRRQGSPSQRIAGAWTELGDLFVEEGLLRPSSATPRETVNMLDRELTEEGSRALAGLGTLVEKAVFSPCEPDIEMADRAWELLPVIRKGLGRSPMRQASVVMLPGSLATASRGSVVNADRGSVGGTVR